MLQPGGQIRYRLAAILAAHWEQFVTSYKGWIRPVVFAIVRKIFACKTPILGCHSDSERF